MAVLRKQAAATILTAPNTYAAEKQGLRKFSAIRDLGIRQLITVTATTKKYLRERRDAVDAFLRGYIEALAYVKAQKDVTMKVIAKYTRQRDPEVLAKFYEDLVPDLPRIPYIDEVSLSAGAAAAESGCESALRQQHAQVDRKRNETLIVCFRSQSKWSLIGGKNPS
jgi:ABC-type nitrate/sulfonate/bicarbonate transport system substrate-binding protein